MTYIDRIADKPWFLASFFSGETKTGRFEAVLVSLGCVALFVGIILAAYMPPAKSKELPRADWVIGCDRPILMAG
jgi:hypothetical protein